MKHLNDTEKKIRRDRIIKNSIKIAERIFFDLCIALLILILAFAGYSEWDNDHLIRDASGDQYARYKPTEKETQSYEELRRENPDVVGWLILNGTSVDYPIVQGSDNVEYINKDVHGEFSLSGALFLDARNDPLFQDPLSIIYGHNMNGPAMFGQLQDYAQEDYLKAHRSGWLYYGDQYYKLTVYSCIKANGNDTSVYHVPMFKGERKEWNRRIQQLTVSGAGTLPSAGRILLLSTCATGQTDERTLIAASIAPGSSTPNFTEPKRSARATRDHVIRRTWMNWKGIVYLLVLLILITILYRRNGRRKPFHGEKK